MSFIAGHLRALKTLICFLNLLKDNLTRSGFAPNLLAHKTLFGGECYQRALGQHRTQLGKDDSVVLLSNESSKESWERNAQPSVACFCFINFFSVSMINLLLSLILSIPKQSSFENWKMGWEKQ